SKEAAERTKRVEEELAPVRARLAEEERRLTDATAVKNGILSASENAYNKAAAASRGYFEMLSKINAETLKRLRLEGKLPAGTDRYTGFGPYDVEDHEEAEAIKALRGQRDAKLAEIEATKSYGKTLAELERQENARLDRMKDIEKILVDENVTQAVKNRALAEYNRLWKDTQGKVKRATDAIKELGENQGRVLSGMPVKTAAGGNVGTSERPQFTSQTGGDGLWGQRGGERRRLET